MGRGMVLKQFANWSGVFPLPLVATWLAYVSKPILSTLWSSLPIDPVNHIRNIGP